MAALPQAPSPAESKTRDHPRSVTSVVEPEGWMQHPLVCLQLCDCDPLRITEICAPHELERLDLHSSDTTSRISHSGLPAGTYRDQEFTGRIVGSMGYVHPDNFVEGRPLSTGFDGLLMYAVLTNNDKFLKEASRRKPRNTRSSRRPEVCTDDVSVTDRKKDRQTREKHGKYTPKSSSTRLVLKRKSCTDGFVSKGIHAHPDNGSVIDSSGEASLSLNASTETPIHHRPEGGLVNRGPSHPAAAEESSTTPLTKTPGSAWLVASSAANHMTGDVSQLTDCTPAPADLVVQVPNMGSRRVHNIGWLRTATMSLQNVYYVPGLDKNLVSSSQLAKLGYTITLGPSECRVTKNDQSQTLVGMAHFTDDYLFELDFLRVPSSTG